MKQVIFFALLLGPVVGWGQVDSVGSVSVTEGFSSRAGTLMEKTFESVGFVKGMEIQVYTVRDLLNDHTVKGVRVQSDLVGQYTTTTRVSVLDADEIDGIVRSIKLMQENILLSIRPHYTEVRFKTRGGFEVGAYFETKKKAWMPYVDFGKVGKSTVFLSIPDLSAFGGYLEAAKKKM